MEKLSYSEVALIQGGSCAGAILSGFFGGMGWGALQGVAIGTAVPGIGNIAGAVLGGSIGAVGGALTGAGLGCK